MRCGMARATVWRAQSMERKGESAVKRIYLLRPACHSAAGRAAMRLKGTIRAGNWLNLLDRHHDFHSSRECLWQVATIQHDPPPRHPDS